MSIEMVQICDGCGKRKQMIGLTLPPVAPAPEEINGARLSVGQLGQGFDFCDECTQKVLDIFNLKMPESPFKKRSLRFVGGALSEEELHDLGIK